jgi:hypothetical protein
MNYIKLRGAHAYGMPFPPFQQQFQLHQLHPRAHKHKHPWLHLRPNLLEPIDHLVHAASRRQISISARMKVVLLTSRETAPLPRQDAAAGLMDILMDTDMDTDTAITTNMDMEDMGVILIIVTFQELASAAKVEAPLKLTDDAVTFLVLYLPLQPKTMLPRKVRRNQGRRRTRARKRAIVVQRVDRQMHRPMAMHRVLRAPEDR